MDLLTDYKKMSVISAKDVSKNFDKKIFSWANFRFVEEKSLAVDKLSVDINEGEFVGFLGPNGAGKTTFLKILSGIIYPSSGEAKVLGYVPYEKNHDFLRQIALVMGQKNQLWWDLPAIDSYKLLAEVYDIEKNRFKKNLDNMVSILSMEKLLPKRLRDMSLGERMKCELVACFLHDPKVIFLDEPTIGLDVVSAQNIRNFLRDINKERGCTIILTSHYMADIEALCPRIVIINQGKKIYDGSITDLKAEYSPEKKIEIFLNNVEERTKFAHINSNDKKLYGNKGIITVSKKELGSVAKEVFDVFKIENISISDPEIEETISKIFLEKNPD